MSVLGFIKSWKLGAVDYYRTYLPLKFLDKNGLSAKCISGNDQVLNPRDDWLLGHDIYTMSRIYNEDYHSFLHLIHSNGGKVVLDVDDDLTETFRMVSGHGDVFKEFLSQVDYVSCSTPPLAELLGQYTKSPTVLRNHLDTKWFRKVASTAERAVPFTTIGFSGSPTHWGDWYLPSVPWARIGKENEDVALMYHGFMYDYMEAVNQTIYKLEDVSYAEYPRTLKQFDILLCAVDDRDEFNAGKSAIKAIEAMSLGVIPICSNFAPYRELKEAGAPIVLLEENTRDAWYEAMRALVKFPGSRATLSAKGPKWVEENRDIRVGWSLWADFYQSIM